MKIANVKDAIKELKRRQVIIGKERDRLRDLELEIATLGDDLEEAVDSLENAIDALSRLQ